MRPLATALTARGRVDGAPVVAFAGSGGAPDAHNIVTAVDTAVRERVPVIGLWQCAGPPLADGLSALDAAGQVFAAVVRASGRVPQISVLLGQATGAAAYVLPLTDVIIHSPGRLPPGTEPDHTTAPETTPDRTTAPGTEPDRTTAPETEADRTTSPGAGRPGLVAPDSDSALAEARRIALLLGSQGRVSPDDVAPGGTTGVPLHTLVPAGTDRAYDARPLVRAILDAPGTELHADRATNMITTLGRLAGRTVGVVATNPLRLGGCLDPSGAEKAARFIRMCNALGVPLIILADSPGLLPGPEPDDAPHRGAKLLHAFAEAVVPRVTVITRRVYGGAYLAMNSRSLGATAVLAWPSTTIAVTGPKTAVNLHHRRTLAAVPPAEREPLRARLLAQELDLTSAARAVELGLVDEIIQPEQTRRRIAETLAATPAGRGNHTNIPL
ncbi:carboxyl transferase domain-containing protein [Actinoplanes sp. NPDC026670]|uniref:carboxyl transferase domain-containing protein n=1 Tax=Actinoplanes sp. NPDC026670 TaxID=3154700 RepID=UPI0033F036EF